ncbi:MAG: iron-sulfur cluster assembly accessory protein [Betaproteobacteria bacterium]|nr:iron-sulfur cluster assembly accessory protein [Betaproteobacteria bacterium]
MVIVTPNAIRQIQDAADRGDMVGMALRVAARRADDGSLEFAMGFDDRGSQDLVVSVEGVELLIHASQQELFEGVTLDFVELEPGKGGFVFHAPSSSCGGCGKGGCSSDQGGGGCA